MRRHEVTFIIALLYPDMRILKVQEELRFSFIYFYILLLRIGLSFVLPTHSLMKTWKMAVLFEALFLLLGAAAEQPPHLMFFLVDDM
jgi:hypothetical protein